MIKTEVIKNIDDTKENVCNPYFEKFKRVITCINCGYEYNYYLSQCPNCSTHRNAIWDGLNYER